MKFVFATIFIFCGLLFSFGQNEIAPIVEKEIGYKDWNYKSVQNGTDTNLRTFTAGKKLVMVVYFAPWCGNWKHDLPFVQAMYDKYKANGFDVIAVGEYDPVDSMKAHISQYKLTFPVVWESDARTAKQKTSHYEYRRSVGDTRNWGSPWYIFLEAAKLEPSGQILAKRAPVVSGELIRPEAEKFIREKLGLAATADLKLNSLDAAEVCDPAKSSTSLVRPEGKP